MRTIATTLELKLCAIQNYTINTKPGMKQVHSLS